MNLIWQPWTPVSEGSSTPGAPVAAVPWEGSFALFISDPNGGVYTIKAVPGYGWTPVDLGRRSKPGGQVTAVPWGNRFALFMTDPSGQTYMTAGIPYQVWDNWTPVAQTINTAGAPVAAVPLGQDFVLFVADLNGEIRTTSSFSEILFESNFDATPNGDPPSTTQLVGTAQVEGLPNSVIVEDPWLRIDRPIGPQNPNSSFFAVLTAVQNVGIYNFSALLFLDNASGIASISFESFNQEFVHIDFLPDNLPDTMVRIDDNSATEFGSFPRNQPFQVWVTLTVAPPNSAVKVELSKNGASGVTTYSIVPVLQRFSEEFAKVQVFQGFPNTGRFYASYILVTKAN